MSSRALFALIFTTLSLGLVACTKIDPPKDQPVQYGGSCSEEYSREYEKILNLSRTAPDLFEVCNEFYARYSGVKCFSQVDGTELRIHTSDFNNKCKRGISSKKSQDADGSSDEAKPNVRKPSKCSNELIDFLVTKQTEFHAAVASIETSDVTDDYLFEKALTSKKVCNQYFFNYNYLTCERDGKAYSFHMLKPYCDIFQTQLHRLKNKNSKKYFPEELTPLKTLNLKFHFQDDMVPFYPKKAKIKDVFLVDGNLIEFSQISSNQNYCYFESPKIRRSGQLKSDLYPVDVTQTNKNRVVFSHTSFNETWRLICHTRGGFYYQDLLEALGEKVTVLE